MSQSQEAVVEFGPAGDDGPPRRRTGIGGFLAGTLRDRRLVPVAAALGALALFGSLISEWQITAIDETVLRGADTGQRPFTTTIADLGGWGGGYLAGLFLLVTATVLTLFGPVAGRAYARLTALSAGGLLLAVVVTLWSYLGETSRIVGQIDAMTLDDDQMQVSVGRGLWCAGVGVALVTLAAWLAGRGLPAPTAAPGEAPGAGAGEEPVEPVWAWRRPPAEEETPEAPFDLTVAPVKPWTASDDSRDKADPGISG
ncbi:hypothetical protein ACPCHT_35845 [Nucisporomicrobium flavum]|uniref:hypothetical protein n=1 Tax=Nucisporomicrobium flavum TaxID=2785915 RepID=UPI0018F55CDD|nr:hypothetical protein [Nucisporomicrobium flavum]